MAWASHACTKALTDIDILSVISTFARFDSGLDFGFLVILISGISPTLYWKLICERHDALDLYHLIADELYARHVELVFLSQLSMLSGSDWDYEERDWQDQLWFHEHMRMDGWDDSD